MGVTQNLDKVKMKAGFSGHQNVCGDRTMAFTVYPDNKTHAMLLRFTQFGSTYGTTSIDLCKCLRQKQRSHGLDNSETHVFRIYPVCLSRTN